MIIQSADAASTLPLSIPLTNIDQATVDQASGLLAPIATSAPAAQATSPLPLPPQLVNSQGFVLDPNGNVVQQAYLAATSQDWHLAVAAPDAGPLPGAADYDTAATLDMIEGLTQLWIGAPNPPACVY